MKITIVVVTLVLALGFALAFLVREGRSRFDRRIAEDVERFEQSDVDVEAGRVGRADLEGLPAPVQRYLQYAGVVGRPRIARARVEQTGAFRLDVEGSWIPLTAEQRYTTNPPRFIWDATMRMVPWVPFRVRDRYDDGDSQMFGTLAGVMPLVDESGPEVEQGSMLRFLGEAAWFPSAFLVDYIDWEPIDDRRARLVARRDGKEVSAVCHFDEEGALRKFVAERYFEREGEYSLETWVGTHDAYREVDGFRVPTESTATWELSTGDFEYVRLNADAFEFETVSEEVGSGTHRFLEGEKRAVDEQSRR